MPCWEQQAVAIQRAQISLFLMLTVQRSAEGSWSAVHRLFSTAATALAGQHTETVKQWQRRGVKEGGRTMQTVCLQIMGIIHFLYSLFKFSLNLSPFSQVYITAYLQSALPPGRNLISMEIKTRSSIQD